MRENKSWIQVKTGLIKRYWFSDEFCKANQSLCDDFNKLYEKMFDGVISIITTECTE